MKKKVLIMAGFYVPSVKAGGPIQSIKNIVDNLSDEIDFYIVAADRDLGDHEPFCTIEADEWLPVGNAKVFYTDYSKLTWRKTKEIIESIDYDVIYLNSFFSYKYTIVPILLSKFNKIQKSPVVVAPRGEFSVGALNLKAKKKKLFIRSSKMIGLYNGVFWHATSKNEKKDIEMVFGPTVEVNIANNLTADYQNITYNKKIDKKEGQLKIAFVSRIHPKKNLKMAIEFLKNIQGDIIFNIYGPMEDENYWQECMTAIKQLPENVKVMYKGIVDQKKVSTIFSQHHIFLFPTLGENFGHVISEALIGGCPVIISDQTPWRRLREHHVGWDIPLSDKEGFIKALEYCVAMDMEEYNALSRSAFNFGKIESNTKHDIHKSHQLFHV